MQKTTTNLCDLRKRERIIAAGTLCGVCLLAILMVLNPTFAATDYVDTIQDIMGNMVDIVGTIFQAVGVILSIYAVGQLILAFKNEDANSKSSASTLLVVGIVLIAVPGIIKALDLVDMIGG